MDFAEVFICLRPSTPYPPPTHCILYSYSHRKGRGGRGGGELNHRELLVCLAYKQKSTTNYRQPTIDNQKTGTKGGHADFFLVRKS
jgi:hypothetical protein